MPVRFPPVPTLRRVARVLAGAVASALLLTGAPALADAGHDEDRWDFDIALYGWLTDMTGDATVGDVRVDIEPQLWNDILKNLDLAAFGAVEARYRKRWIVNVDLNFAKISSDGETDATTVGFGPATFERRLGKIDAAIPVETRFGTLRVPVQADPGVLSVNVPRVETTIGPFDVDTTLTQIITRGLVGYRAIDVRWPQLFGGDREDDPRRLRVDFLAGLRYYYLETKVKIDGPPIEIPSFRVTSSVSGGSVRVGGDRIPGRTVALERVTLPDVEFSGATFGGTHVDVDESIWWIDPVVGVRFGAGLSEKLSVVLTGNVGGFGVGSASEFSWEGALFGNYQFGEHWSFAAGYRGLGFKKESGALTLDLIEHGPVIGFIYRF